MIRITNFPLGLMLLAFGVFGCASQKTLETNPPFNITQPTVQDWMGGREASGSGTVLQMRYVPAEPEAYTLETLYFRGRALTPEVKDTETGMVLTASYLRGAPTGVDMIMDDDTRKEVGNQPPMPLEPTEPIPFTLERDQAVLAYIRKADGKRFFYKISGIKEIQTRALPGRPQR